MIPAQITIVSGLEFKDFWGTAMVRVSTLGRAPMASVALVEFELCSLSTKLVKFKQVFGAKQNFCREPKKPFENGVHC